ncbi:hypothetical protein JCM11641_008360 [Rhodosporidiobolus odoratus]
MGVPLEVSPRRATSARLPSTPPPLQSTSAINHSRPTASGTLETADETEDTARGSAPRVTGSVESGPHSANRPLSPLYTALDASTPSPSHPILPLLPIVPFDAPESDSAASWTRWLDERRERRSALAAASASTGMPPTVRIPHSSISRSTADRLDRLRQSAERLRSIDRNVDQVASRQAARRATLPDPPPLSPTATTIESSAVASSSLENSLESSRQMLEQVRRRLDDTRDRVVAATARIQRTTEDGSEVAVDEREVANGVLRDSRDNLDRTASFITRLEQLTQTLSDLSERAATLAPSPPSPLLRQTVTPRSPPRAPSSASPLRSTPLESASSALNTDGIRHTVRQLVQASRRVSAAIDRHRESVATATAATASSPNPAEEHIPLLRPDTPLRVSLPPSPSTRPSTPPGTSPNPSGLLLPTATGTFFFTASPQALSPSPPPATSPSTTVPPLPPRPRSSAEAETQAQAQASGRENYPGERDQLLRIAHLQQDIAQRADQLRELRARGREIEEDQHRPSGRDSREGEVKDDDVEQLEHRRGTAVVTRTLGTARKSKEEKARDYQVWARCGR